MATIIQILRNVLNDLDDRLANETRRIHLKEVLQSLVLDFIYNHPHYRDLNFYGGTCLHILYGLNRLSEDIDLDNSGGLDLDPFGDDLLDYFHQTWSIPEVSLRSQEGETGILRMTLRFPVLYELGLSPHRVELLHLKVEISRHPQTAVIQHTPVIHAGRSFVPSHFSMETMMAGKMLACLERSFRIGTTGISIKGRDYYDLLWFMQKRIVPLEEKLEKDGIESWTVLSAMLALQKKVEKIRPRDLEIDLLPLFEQPAYIEAWIATFHENFDRYLKEYV